MDDAAREAAVAAALEHIRRSTAYSAVLRGYGSYEQYEDVAERLSEIRVSASMLPAAGAAAQRMAAMRAALREVPVPPQSPPLTVVYLRLIGEFLDKIVRHPDYISLAADEVQPSTEGYNDILNALWHVKRVLEKIVVADDTPVLVAVSARYGQVAREFGRMEARLLTDEDTDLPAPTVEFVHWQRQQGRAAGRLGRGKKPWGVKGVPRARRRKMQPNLPMPYYEGATHHRVDGVDVYVDSPMRDLAQRTESVGPALDMFQKGVSFSALKQGCASRAQHARARREIAEFEADVRGLLAGAQGPDVRALERRGAGAPRPVYLFAAAAAQPPAAVVRARKAGKALDRLVRGPAYTRLAAGQSFADDDGEALP